MIYHNHYTLRGKHAFLSPSNYHWLKYNPDKLRTVYSSMKKKELGTILHDLASRMINLGVKAEHTDKALNLFVNDVIDYNMESELVLYYSEYCYGTADALSFDGDCLRIFDLKTGDTKAKFEQLHIYAAIFCLEYKVNPNDIYIEERIYQYDGYTTMIPEPELILDIMDKIVLFDEVLFDYQP